MKNCLFIGNGLNRCLDNSISWKNIMSYVSNEINVASCEGISLPMDFERMANEYMIQNNAMSDAIYSKMKKIISQKLQKTKLPKDAIHHLLPELPLDAIMTTNYDYLLEYAYDEDYKCEYSKTKKYIFGETSEIGNCKFYHPHGIAKLEQSLCLGYEHYMGIVQNLRNELNTKKEGKDDERAIKRVLFGEEKAQNTWGEMFYTSNIAFVGFGLDDCEADIWWLLTHRAFLYHTNYQRIREKLTNTIVYYDILDMVEKKDPIEECKRKTEVERKQRKHTLLNSYHVKVKTYKIESQSENHHSFFKKILNDIQTKGIC